MKEILVALLLLGVVRAGVWKRIDPDCQETCVSLGGCVYPERCITLSSTCSYCSGSIYPIDLGKRDTSQTEEEREEKHIAIACPAIGCLTICPQGYALDPRGCPTCDCLSN